MRRIHITSNIWGNYRAREHGKNIGIAGSLYDLICCLIPKDGEKPEPPTFVGIHADQARKDWLEITEYCWPDK